MKKHKVKIEQIDRKTEVYLDDFKVKGVVGYEVKSPANTGITELTLRVLVDNLHLGFDDCGNNFGSNLCNSAE